MDRGALWATVHGVEKSWTQLSDECFHFYLEASGYHTGQPGFEVSGRIKARKAVSAPSPSSAVSQEEGISED